MASGKAAKPMLEYLLTFSSTSKRDLYKAYSQMCRSLEINYRLTRTLKAKDSTYSPPVYIVSPSFRKVKRYTPERTHFGFIRSPFVHKKSGENFVYEFHNAEIPVELEFREKVPIRDPRGTMKFLLRNHPSPLGYPNVELRIQSLEANPEFPELPELEKRPSKFSTIKAARPENVTPDDV